MIALQVVIYLAAFCTADKSILFATSSFVTEITTVELFKEMHLSPHNVLMLFYSHKLTNEHLDEIFDEYTEVAKRFTNIALFSAINCEMHKPDDKKTALHLSICNHFEILRYPTLILLRPREYEQIPDKKGEGKSFLKRPYRYIGEFTAAGMSEWVTFAMEDIVQRIDSREMLEEFVAKSFPESTKLIVLGSTVEPPAWLNFVAQAVRPDSPLMRKAAFVGYCHDAAIVFGEAWEANAQTSPTIVLLSPEMEVKSVYSDALEYEGVKDWIIKHAGKPLDFSKLTPKPIPTKDTSNSRGDLDSDL
jgi:hypothetical protein